MKNDYFYVQMEEDRVKGVTRINSPSLSDQLIEIESYEPDLMGAYKQGETFYIITLYENGPLNFALQAEDPREHTIANISGLLDLKVIDKSIIPVTLSEGVLEMIGGLCTFRLDVPATIACVLEVWKGTSLVLKYEINQDTGGL